MLAKDTVESRISKRDVCSAAQSPFDRGGRFNRSACAREHALVEIQADHLSCRTDTTPRQSARRPCGGPTSAARVGKAGNLQVPGLHFHLRVDTQGQVPAYTEIPTDVDRPGHGG